MGKKERRKSLVKDSNATTKSKEQEQLYLIQIKDLTSKLERRKQLVEELQQINNEYKKKYEKEVKDKEDIVAYLKHTIENFTVEMNHLREKIIGLQKEHETEKKNSENKLISLEKGYNQALENLKEENLTLTGKLASLEKFESEKENLYKEHEKFKSTYKQEVENYEERILNLQQQYALDCKRLKKEYEEKQEAEKEYYFSDEQTEYAIKTAFSQIKKLKKELYDNTEMTMKLTKENEAVILLKNKCVQQKDLLEKLKNIEKCYEGLLKQEEASKLQIKELTVNVTSMSTNITDINKQLEFYKNEIKMQEEANVKLIIIILKAAKAIKEATMHTPKNEEEKELLIQKRYDLLHSLNTLLESSHEFYNDYYFDVLHSHGVPAEEIQKWFEEKDIPPKYKLGNLGIIPKVEKSKFKQDKENDLTLSQRKFDELQLREKAILSSVSLLTAYENLVKKLSEEKE
ncbi:cilia- and flagella-associated protein 157-like isoform X2 [Centruroides vittatus]|uniref:cilia- and flagella-associated protein 157-like isoform X2 n=1 Tax=Centruroides vittatus TaxID=120091 RepID=UPI0035103052